MWIGRVERLPGLSNLSCQTDKAVSLLDLALTRNPECREQVPLTVEIRGAQLLPQLQGLASLQHLVEEAEDLRLYEETDSTRLNTITHPETIPTDEIEIEIENAKTPQTLLISLQDGQPHLVPHALQGLHDQGHASEGIKNLIMIGFEIKNGCAMGIAILQVAEIHLQEATMEEDQGSEKGDLMLSTGLL